MIYATVGTVHKVNEKFVAVSRSITDCELSQIICVLETR